MTDKQKSEVRATAAALETLDMGGVADLVRRLYAENETLRNRSQDSGRPLSCLGSDAIRSECETLRAGYAAARLEIESLRGKGWQPIETAPKDGTFLLLWEQYSTNPFIGSWLGTRWTVSHEHVDAEGGWDGANVVDALSMPVTHWMPLPAAPGPADGESNG